MIVVESVGGIALVALYTVAWVMVVLLALELAPSRRPAPMPAKTGNADDRPDRKRTRQAFSAEDDVNGEGARPSSLIPYYRHKPDPDYLLQLKYAVEIANEETIRKYGPLTTGGLPVRKKAKPDMYRDFSKEEEMKSKYIATAAAMTIAGTLAACDDNRDAVAVKTEISATATPAFATLHNENEPSPESTSGTHVAKPSTQTELAPFVEPGMRIRDKTRGDINNDDLPDVIAVVESAEDKKTPRSVVLLVSDTTGVLHKMAQNDKIVPCFNCGGIFGDPFSYVQLSNGVITVVTEGGSREHWWNEYVFKYSPSSKNAMLISVKRGISDTSTGRRIEINYTSKDFGSIKFEDFDPSTLPEAKLP